MKQKLLFSAALCLGMYGATGQIIVSPAVQTPFTLGANGASTPMNVVFNPNFNIYYTTGGGYTGCTMNTFDVNGNFLTSTTQNIDYRGSWWNPNTNEEEVNEYSGTQLKAQDLDPGTGWPLSTWTTLISEGQPEGQSMGSYDANNNWVVFNEFGTLYEYDRATGNLLNTYTMTGIPNGTGSIVNYAIGATQVPGYDYVVYDYSTQQAYFINTLGQYVGYSQIPAGAPTESSYNMSYSNGYMWLSDYNNWYGYQIIIPCSATVNAGGPTEFCQGGNVVLHGNIVAGATYQWQNNGTDIAGATDSTYMATTSGPYTLTVTNLNCGAIVSTALTVTVDPLPASAITAAGSATLCSGNTVVLNANAGATTYQWQQNGIPVPFATNSSYTTGVAGTYTVAEVSAQGCTATSAGQTVIVNPTPAPTIGVTVQGGNLLLSVANTFTTYQWSKNGTDITGATTSSYVATNGGLYVVTVTNSSNCTGYDTLNLSGLAVQQVQNGASINMYPNPNTGSFTLAGTVAGDGNDMSISVTDVTGREVLHQAVRVNNHMLNEKINMDNQLPAGHYTLKMVSDGQQTFVLPFVKQ